MINKIVPKEKIVTLECILRVVTEVKYKGLKIKIIKEYV